MFRYSERFVGRLGDLSREEQNPDTNRNRKEYRLRHDMQSSAGRLYPTSYGKDRRVSSTNDSEERYVTRRYADNRQTVFRGETNARPRFQQEDK
jgi:hypothetical protein